MEVRLTTEESAEARRLAEFTHARWKNTTGHYRNLPRSHLLGKLGEVAAEKWARDQGVDVEAVFRDLDREREADLIVGVLRVDVKTWTAAYWDNWGRCVAVSQLPRLRTKADAILWTTHDDTSGADVVTLRGWSTMVDVTASEVRETGPAYRTVVNHQLDPPDLREISTLLDAARGSVG